MRTMELPLFPNKIEISDFEHYYRTRLGEKADLKASWGIPLLGYMGWPNQEEERKQAIALLKDWLNGSDSPLPENFTAMHQAWVRVTDIVHLHYDLARGNHQEARGGASVGKAIFLASKNAQARGTGQATLWSLWGQYKDVAHVIAATMLVCGDLKERHKTTSLRLNLQQLLPARVALMMPELILAVGRTYQDHGLDHVPFARSEPMFDPETIWRIPAEINVAAIAPPRREIRPEDSVILNDRRAGNRGRRDIFETTPIQ
jgi:hypothetical protein